MKVNKATYKNNEISSDEKDMKLFQFVFDKRHRIPTFLAIKEMSKAIYNVDFETNFIKMFHNDNATKSENAWNNFYHKCDKIIDFSVELHNLIVKLSKDSILSYKEKRNLITFKEEIKNLVLLENMDNVYSFVENHQKFIGKYNKVFANRIKQRELKDKFVSTIMRIVKGKPSK